MCGDKRRMLISTMPACGADRFGLFKVVPQNIVVLPVLFENEVKAVIELASVSSFTALQMAFLEQLTDGIGIVLNSIEATMQTEGFLKQSQQLAASCRRSRRSCSRPMSNSSRRRSSLPSAMSRSSARTRRSNRPAARSRTRRPSSR